MAEVGRLRTDAEKDGAAWSEGGFLSIGACPKTAAVDAIIPFLYCPWLLGPGPKVGRLRTGAEKDEAAWSEGGFLSIGACPRTAAVVAWRGWLPFKRGPTVAWAFEREVLRPDVYEGCEGEDGPFKVISNFFAADVLSVAVGSWAEAS